MQLNINCCHPKVYNEAKLKPRESFNIQHSLFQVWAWTLQTWGIGLILHLIPEHIANSLRIISILAKGQSELYTLYLMLKLHMCY